MFDGIQEVEVNGKKYGFRFSPMAVAIAEREDGCKAGELFQKIQAGDQLAILNIFYGAAVDYCKVKGIKQDFTASAVADWFYDIGTEKAMEIFNNGMTAYTEKISKNLKAPAQTGA